MDDPLDLYHASREDLIRLVMRQREQIADLEQRLARQEAELATLRATISQLSERVGALLAAGDPPSDEPSGRPQGMPGLKAPSPRGAPPAPRKRRARGYGRRHMRATARQVHAVSQCPLCRTPPRVARCGARGRSSSSCPARWWSQSMST